MPTNERCDTDDTIPPDRDTAKIRQGRIENHVRTEAIQLPAHRETGKPMAQFLRSPLVLFALLGALAGQPTAAGAQALTATGWDLEKDVDAPSYAVAEPTSTDLNIDSVVLSCEQGPNRRGLQLRIYLSDAGPLAPRAGGTLKDEPRFELVIDGKSHPAQLAFADTFVVVADSADGTMPLLSSQLLDAIQAGRRMELRFDLVREAKGQAPSFDGTTVLDLRAGRGGAAVAAVRRCAGEAHPQVAETPRRR